jgi:hypothetical protein
MRKAVVPGTVALNRKVIASFLLLIAFRVYSLEITVTVFDRDMDMPLEGAVIEMPDGARHETDGAGSVRVTIPDQGQVLLRVSYPGYETARIMAPRGGAVEYTVYLELSSQLYGDELVIEDVKPGASETKSGRSVAISGENLSRTAEIGVIEDLFSSLKSLPGVGYTGTFNSHPSIRGGDPGDLVAVFDGFYIEDPYHFGGAVSIFDPRMIDSAQLSHGIFSTRFGMSISGILDIKAKQGDTELSFIELGASTSAANVNIARPLGKNGSIMLMAKATYWAPFIWFLQGISPYVNNPAVQAVNALTTAPYIASGALSGFYRFTPDLLLSLNGYFGADGGGADYITDYNNIGGFSGHAAMFADWINTQGFISSSLTFNPRPNIMLKFILGGGFHQTDLDAVADNVLGVPFTNEFVDYGDGATATPPPIPGLPSSLEGLRKLNYGDHFNIDQHAKYFWRNKTDSFQARTDFDFEINENFILAAGVEERYTRWYRDQDMQGSYDKISRIDNNPVIPNPSYPDTYLYLSLPYQFKTDSSSHAWTTSLYTLTEWKSAKGFFAGEAGLRVDSFNLSGKGFSIDSAIALNPRANFDFNVLKDKKNVQNLSFTLGTGLFSSIVDGASEIDGSSGIKDKELKPNRSWTTVLGLKLDFFDQWTFTLEGYYKRVFSRAYRVNELNTDDSGQTMSGSQKFYFDGVGNVGGFDFMIQRRYHPKLDGWLTYTFTYARYKEPQMAQYSGASYQADGYFPDFLRFHNINLILNFRATPKFHIALRAGFASGQNKAVVGDIQFYPVLVYNTKNESYYIQKYKRKSGYSDDSWTTPSVPLDVKFSWFFRKKGKRATGEFYVAIENLASLVYTSKANTSFNTYTGRDDVGSMGATYELPVPLPSIGIKYSY